MCYYFDDIFKLEDFDFHILLDKKSYKNILIYHISNKTLIGAKPLHIMVDTVNGFIRDYDETEYLVLFGLERYDAFFNRISYLIGLKNSITYVFSHNYTNITVDLNADFFIV